MSRGQSQKTNEADELENAEKLMEQMSLISICRCVEQYFTVLYGMFPSNVLHSVSKFSAASSKTLFPFQGTYPTSIKKVKDPLDVYKVEDNHPACVERFRIMLNQHKMHPHILLSPQDELREPWFIRLEGKNGLTIASETMVACYEKKISEPIDKIENCALETLNDLSNTLLNINSSLHGNLKNPSSKPMDSPSSNAMEFKSYKLSGRDFKIII